MNEDRKTASPLDRDLGMAQLWAMGKSLGCDAHAVSVRLAAEVRRLQAELSAAALPEVFGWALFDKQGYCSWFGIVDARRMTPDQLADPWMRGLCAEHDKFAPDAAPHRLEPIYRRVAAGVPERVMSPDSKRNNAVGNDRANPQGEQQ